MIIYRLKNKSEEKMARTIMKMCRIEKKTGKKWAEFTNIPWEKWRELS